MSEENTIAYLLYVVAGMVAFILVRVWKVPSIEAKLDNVIKETDRTRDGLHDVRNTLYTHETRITLLEKSETKDSQP
jgi:hypothetical protein